MQNDLMVFQNQEFGEVRSLMIDGSLGLCWLMCVGF